jgi:hypothetical protein
LSLISQLRGDKLELINTILYKILDPFITSDDVEQATRVKRPLELDIGSRNLFLPAGMNVRGASLDPPCEFDG